MAMCRCNECDQFIDDDYHPMSEDPRDGCKLVCEGCIDELDEELTNEIT